MRKTDFYEACIVCAGSGQTGTRKLAFFLIAAVFSVSAKVPTQVAADMREEHPELMETASEKDPVIGKMATPSNGCAGNNTTATSSDAQMENEPDEVFLEDDITPLETEQCFDAVPQISVTVPTETVILLGADGTCIAADSRIQNNGNVPVYLEQVACTWNTDTQDSTEMIFTDWQEQKPYATLILDGGETHQFHPGESGTAVWEDMSGGMYTIAAGEALELTWEFSLNENCVTEVLVAEKEAAVATVTYTVSSQAL